MWPGQQQPGGAQNPQDPQGNPYQQPGYGYPNPYQQPAPPQAGPPQPNPYAQQQPTVPQWPAPGMPATPPPDGGRGRRTTVIAVGAAVAVVAAAVITGVVVLKDDDKGKDPVPAAKDASPSASAPSAAPSSAAPGNNPRAGGSDAKPVIAGWKVVVNPKRHVAYDVPADWDVATTGSGVTIPDTSEAGRKEGKLAEAMSSPAYFQREQCVVKNDKGYDETYSAAITGAKGAQGAKNLQEAAENSAASWAWAMFDQEKKGKFDIGKAQPFTSDHGITGFTATTSANNVPKGNKCSSDGKAFSVAYKDANGDFQTWIFSGVKGKDNEVPDDTIKKIMSTLRPLTSS
ncbi:hypothetical protein [Streptomyces sp. NPDC049555]|uniref:hypothetical protein n=1 Tax=Streptomyces sp. NPDC049555 TaxID=3154930 RepID=UPI003440080C